MQRVRSGDAEIAYQVMGDGPAVVLLHAFPANHEMWVPAAEILSTRYRLILPDLRGHGDSEIGDGPATMAKHAADIARVCDETGIGRAIFVGVSIGGYALFEFWRRYRQRVSALILCDTRASADSPEAQANRLKSAEEAVQRGPEAVIDGLVPKLLGQSTQTARPDLVAAARRMMLKMSADDIAQVQRGMAERPDSIPTLKTIDVPSMVLVGDADVLTPVAEAEVIRQNIPRCELRVIAKAGHYSPFEQHQTAATLIRQFLDGLPRVS